MKTLMTTALSIGLMLALHGAAVASDGVCREELYAPVHHVDTEARTLTVAGVVVTVSDSTSIESKNDKKATLADIKPGDNVEVEGTRTADGWTACEIEIRRAPKVKLLPAKKHEIEATIESIDTNAGTLVVGGVTVQTSDKTKFENGHDKRTTLDTFKVGDRVEAEGRVDEAGILQASKLEQE